MPLKRRERFLFVHESKYQYDTQDDFVDATCLNLRRADEIVRFSSRVDLRSAKLSTVSVDNFKELPCQDFSQFLSPN